MLGVSSSVDGITLRRAFRRLSKALHPDTTSLPIDEAARKFQQVCEAYELLSDPIRRKAYDNSLAAIHTSHKKHTDDWLLARKSSSSESRTLEVRRSLSGGELFSLVLLIGAILISSFLAIIFALSHGKELQVRPSWLVASTKQDKAFLHKSIQSSSFFGETIARKQLFELMILREN